jgi:hypothetical protein
MVVGLPLRGVRIYKHFPGFEFFLWRHGAIHAHPSAGTPLKACGAYANRWAALLHNSG